MKHSTTKSEAWLFAMCSGDCPTNCTSFGGKASVWGYVNKSVNPFLRDRVKEDPKLKVMCKGKTIFTIITCISTIRSIIKQYSLIYSFSNLNVSEDYVNSIQTKVLECTTDNSGKDKNKACQFPFKFRGKLQNSCIGRGAKSSKKWCATQVGKRRQQIKGKWGNCDQEKCQSLDFESARKSPSYPCNYTHRIVCKNMFRKNIKIIIFRK